MELIEEKKMNIVKALKLISPEMGLGTLLAMFISAVTWKSVIWFIIHGIFGWYYVLYFIAKYSDLIPAIFETIKGWF